MKCYACQGRTRVHNTKKLSPTRTIRQRECLACGERFTTDDRVRFEARQERVWKRYWIDYKPPVK